MANPWMLTASGQRVDLIDPKPETIVLGDIIWHLAHTNRFTGAASRPLSVLEHSLNVAELVRLMGGSHRAQLGGLMHDAHEAYLGDISSPMKGAFRVLGGGPAVTSLVVSMDAAIWKALGLPSLSVKDRELVHLADYWALAFERKELMPDHPAWRIDLKDAPAHIVVCQFKSVPLHQMMGDFEWQFRSLKAQAANRRKAA